MTVTIEPAIGASQPVKKEWAMPQLMMISQNRIGGGPLLTINEQDFTKTVHPSSAPFVFTLVGPGGRTHQGGDSRHHYHS